MNKYSSWLYAACLIAVLAIVCVGISQWFYLRRAHSSFENYYSSRGCVELVDKTDDYGICKTSSGKTIKIVKYRGKWYLEGDLPRACLGGICFGL